MISRFCMINVVTICYLKMGQCRFKVRPSTHGGTLSSVINPLCRCCIYLTVKRGERKWYQHCMSFPSLIYLYISRMAVSRVMYIKDTSRAAISQALVLKCTPPYYPAYQHGNGD
jgi:hypothetical protein